MSAEAEERMVTMKNKKKKLNKFITSFRFGMPSFMEYVTGQRDYKRHQVRPVEDGWSTPRAERKRAIADVIERETYARVSHALEESHRQISLLCEEYDCLVTQKEDAVNAPNTEEQRRQEAYARAREKSRTRRKEEIHLLLAELREETILWDMLLCQDLEWIEAKMQKSIAAYWKGILSGDTQHEIGLRPSVKKTRTYPEEQYYRQNKERMERMLDKVLYTATAQTQAEEKQTTDAILQDAA